MAGWIVGIVVVMFLVGAVLERCIARFEKRYWQMVSRGEETFWQERRFVQLQSFMSVFGQCFMVGTACTGLIVLVLDIPQSTESRAIVSGITGLGFGFIVFWLAV